MIFPEQRFRLKDGRTCALRAAQPEDAEAMLDYLRTTAAETPYLLREPEEVTMTIEAERAFLKNSLDDPRALMLTVWVDGQLAGNGSLSPVGSVSRVRHRCSLGIAFYQKYCGLGRGRRTRRAAWASGRSSSAYLAATAAQSAFTKRWALYAAARRRAPSGTRTAAMTTRS